MPETFNMWEICFHLDAAECAAAELRKAIEAGEYTSDDIIPLAIAFEQIQSNLNRAWHLRRLTDAETESLTDEQHDAACLAVPRWHVESRMVGLDDLEELRSEEPER
ncbi:MAG: hypothetical protein JJU33_05245 [Phycisphaerales bacterium]|nr:hypothetical protein [Phycisphaerales bacterium]